MSQHAAQIGPGSRVRLHFSITLEDGTVADDTFAEQPIDVVLGEGTLHPGLEQPLIGLRQGEHRTFHLMPEQAFGYADPEAVHILNRSEFPEDMELQPGTIINFTTPAGHEIPGMVKAVAADTVTVDFNHPLAGHELTFSVKILEVAEP